MYSIYNILLLLLLLLNRTCTAANDSRLDRRSNTLNIEITARI